MPGHVTLRSGMSSVRDLLYGRNIVQIRGVTNFDLFHSPHHIPTVDINRYSSLPFQPLSIMQP